MTKSPPPPLNCRDNIGGKKIMCKSIPIRCVKCQMAFGTPNPKKSLISGILNAKIFGMSEQYNLKIRSVRTKMVKFLIFFYSLFSPLSHHFILFFLSSLITFLISFSLILYQPRLFSFFTLFSAHSRCFSLFLSALPCHLLNLISIFFFFFFFRDLMGGFVNGWV